MLDINYIVNNPEAVAENCARRGYDADLDQILALDRRRRSAVGALDDVRRDVAAHSRGWKQAVDQDEHRARAAQLKAERDRLEAELAELDGRQREQLEWLPNLLDPRVPVGDEEENQIVRTVGEPTKFDFEPRPHEEIGRLTNTIDIPRGVNVAGSRFYCLLDEAVRIRYALSDLFAKHARQQGFQLVSPPYLARRETLFASGYLPFQGKENFAVRESELSLIGTSEQALLGMHLEETLTSLPKLYLGDSMCFRTEAGSYGRDTAGILRVHQFFKMEQFVLCHPSESEHYHQLCLQNAEWLMQQLGVPYQVVLTASKDLGAPGRIKYDTEAWLPSQQRYREMTSDTNMGDYQARRGRIKYRLGEEKGYPHTISATGFCDRLIIAILENFQQEDGSVRLPEPLVPYLGAATIPVKATT